MLSVKTHRGTQTHTHIYKGSSSKLKFLLQSILNRSELIDARKAGLFGQVHQTQYHVLHSAQVFGTLVVAVVFSQLGSCEAVLVLDGQVHTVHHQDLTTLWTRQKQQRQSW